MEEFKQRYVGCKSPLEKADIFSKALFSWMGPMFAISSKCIFQQDMFYRLREEDKAQNSFSRVLLN